MYSQFHLDYRDEEQRPDSAYEPKHYRREVLPMPVAPPPWASAESRQGLPPLVGEAATQVVTYSPLPPSEALPTRHPQSARRWQVRFGELGRALTALRWPR